MVATKLSTDEMSRVVEEHGFHSYLTAVHFKDLPKLLEVYMDER